MREPRTDRPPIGSPAAGVNPSAWPEVARDIEAARSGCLESFGLLAERCRAYLMRVAKAELGEDLRAKVGASDLVQDTLMQAHAGISRFRGTSEDELLAWLRQILMHNVLHTAERYRGTAMRDIRRELPIDAAYGSERILHEAADWSTPSKELLAAERVATLRGALARLSASHREMIVLRNVEHRSFETIGQMTQRSAQAARKLWVRAIEALRQELSSSDDSR